MAEKNLISFAEFLESYPQHTIQDVSEYSEEVRSSYKRIAPTIRLFCSKCKGMRNFDGKWIHEGWIEKNEPVEDFLTYRCRDCQEITKTFCTISQPTGNFCGKIVKIGEIPEQHLDLPDNLENLLGKNYQLFLKGLACEKRGLGIGAFTYYRRVVESQKNHLFSEILRVAEKLNTPATGREKLKEAITINEFSRAIEIVKKAIPESLLIDSHNPMKLLYKALSTGLHEEDDDSCLKIAHTIRLVLSDLSLKIDTALKDQTAIKSAISKLLNFNDKKK